MLADFSLLEKTFPFFIVVDRQLRIVKCGRMLRHVLPAAKDGAAFADHFEVERPDVVSVDFERLQAQSKAVFLIKARSRAALTLRCQLVAEPVANRLAFVGSPWITDLKKLSELGLTLADFPPHEPLGDYLLALQTTKASLDDAHRLADQLRDHAKLLSSTNDTLARTNERLRDEIEERLKVERTLHETQRQLQALNATLERRVEERTAELQAVNAELEAFSYSVSHDLRAPLRHIDGFSNIVIEEYRNKLDERAQRYLKRVSDSARHLGLLVDELLAFSRAGRAALRPEATDTRRLVEEVLDELAPDLQGHHVEVQVGALPMVSADPTLLRLVFMNLIDNAIKYSRVRSSPRIEIGRAADENDQVVLYIRDNGVGFDMQYAHKLFGVFQRLHGPEEFEGTGIGLANARRIIKRHGGRIWAEGAVEVGAVFYFSLSPATKESGI